MITFSRAQSSIRTPAIAVSGGKRKGGSSGCGAASATSSFFSAASPARLPAVLDLKGLFGSKVVPPALSRMRRISSRVYQRASTRRSVYCYK